MREWPPPPAYKAKIWTKIWTKYDAKCFKNLGRHTCRTKLPPKMFISTRNMLWKTRKGIRKTIWNATEKVLAPLRPLNRHFSKSFSPAKISKNMFYFSPRGSAGVVTLTKANSTVWGPNVCSYFCLVCGGWDLKMIPQATAKHATKALRQSRPKCTFSRQWFAVEACDLFTRSNCTQRFFLGNRLRFLCGNDTVAVAMHLAMKNGQTCFSLRKFPCDFACDSKNR